MKTLLFCLGLLLSSQSYAKFAGERYYPSLMNHHYSESCVCPSAPNDPFDLGAMMAMGPHKGKCQNNCEIRTIVPLSFIEQYPYMKKHEIGHYHVVANFSHLGKFYVAKIPRQGMKSVIGQKVTFYMFPKGIMKFLERNTKIVGAAHFELRFTYSKDNPVILEPQDGEGETIHLTDVIYSVEYNAPEGVEFDADDGNKGKKNPSKRHYHNSYRFKSLEDTIQMEVFERSHFIEQIELNFTKKERETLLEDIFQTAIRKGMHSTYHLTTASCASEAFTSIDKIVRERGTKIGWVEETQPSLPHVIEWALKSRKLIKPQNGLEYVYWREEYCQKNPDFNEYGIDCRRVLDRYNKELKKGKRPKKRVLKF